MKPQNVLIVDDEESILLVLKNSLKKLGYLHIVTATDGFLALDELQTQPFDVVVTDYNMAKMDGLELLEAIHYLQPAVRVIIITAYGNQTVKQEAQRLQAYSYLTKPLDIRQFRTVVQDALQATPNLSDENMLVLSENRYQQIHNQLEALRNEVGARCLFLTNIQGDMLARSGSVDKVPIQEMACLLGGGIATLSQTGELLDGNDQAINLMYREGDREYLYALNINQNVLLILIIDKGQYSSRLGTVWYYAQQAAVALQKMLLNSQRERETSQQLFTSSTNQAFQTELDKLFDNEIF